MKNITAILLSLGLIFGLSTSALAHNEVKTIRFATEATYPPYVTMDPNGDIGGFETKLVKALCKEAGLPCEFKHLPFDSLFPSLALKKVDAVYGAIAINKERKNHVLFSKILFTNPVGFIFAKSKQLNTDPGSLKGKIIAIQQGTIGFEKFLKEQFPDAQFKAYASIQDALMELDTGRVDTVFGDLPVFKYWMISNQKPNFDLQAIKEEEVKEFSEGTGIAVRKEDQELINQLNQALDKLIAEGTVQKLKLENLE